MRIELRDADRTPIGRVEIDPAERPTRVAVDGGDREVFLQWEGAVDDAGRLRKCVSCGCADMFQEKAFPQVTGFVIVLAFAGAVLGVVEFAQGTQRTPAMLVAMAVVLLLDVGILVFSQKRLICYRCRSRYRDLEMARYHGRWDRAVADRYPAPTKPVAEPRIRAKETTA